MISRMMVQRFLGIIWFVDGVLQLKPQMFTPTFIKQVILPTAVGQPHLIESIVNWGAGVAFGHIVMWNAVFAAIQLLLGLALMFNFKVKTTIVASLIWSAIVWIFGEGFGQLLTGLSLLLTGAPGAALIYGLIGVAVWPDRSAEPSAWNPRGTRFARFSLAGLFILGCLLQLQRNYLTPTGLSQGIALPWLANEIGNHGVLVSFMLALTELVIAAMLILGIRVRMAVWAAVVLSLAFWWLGQSFGQVLDPLSTDFNSGLLMAVLALCSDPQLLSGTAEIEPFGHRTSGFNQRR